MTSARQRHSLCDTERRNDDDSGLTRPAGYFVLVCTLVNERHVPASESDHFTAMFTLRVKVVQSSALIGLQYGQSPQDPRQFQQSRAADAGGRGEKWAQERRRGERAAMDGVPWFDDDSHSISE